MTYIVCIITYIHKSCHRIHGTIESRAAASTGDSPAFYGTVEIVEKKTVMELTASRLRLDETASQLMAPDDAQMRDQELFCILSSLFFLGITGSKNRFTKEKSIMNCYHCWLETQSSFSPALGVCQRCGAGSCEQHLVQVVSRPVSGMGTMMHAGRRLLCSRCYEESVSPASSQRQQKKQAGLSRPTWWKWFRSGSQDDLPEPGEAVAFVERLLKRQQTR